MEPDRYSVSISDDASTVVVGEPGYDGDRGRVCVYDIAVSLDESSWNRRGDCLAGLATGDEFGAAVSISGDGLVVAVGAPYGEGQTPTSGYVMVYSWDLYDDWTPLGDVIDGATSDEMFGKSVDISSDGFAVIVGAPGFNSAAGYWVILDYDDDDGTWSMREFGLASGDAGDRMGESVSISDDGTTIAFGSPQSDDVEGGYGYVAVWQWDGSALTQFGVHVGSASDYAGYSVSLSGELRCFFFFCRRVTPRVTTR